METVVTDYLATWNAQGEERSGLLARHFAEDVTYTDPLAVSTGRDQLGAVIGAVQEQFPGMSLRPHGTPDGHHDQVRFQWALGPADGEPVVIGFDVLVVDSQGLISDVRGFLDKVPG
ncbi:nuclear transport factor 2 family protein [Enemella evansiae]|uniref:nuclear transport factor 2 family protein n=1 Tax=Enemella evansiae TaxID=2016499 RepID=UPI000B979569|nr:nuclear transport factor 2 family protein [Enemella evansiae]OYO08506.1 polyketide cyclase [Enemella evansiae]TDO93701.1 SnoaL-like protein [Enemella evansiae]